MSGIDLYKRESPRWIFYPPDTLVWAGIGGSVELSLNELKRAIKRADKYLLTPPKASVKDEGVTGG